MSTNAIFLTGFFDELKRRKVYRVAVAYVIAVGGVIQLASAVFPAWELPGWKVPGPAPEIRLSSVLEFFAERPD